MKKVYQEIDDQKFEESSLQNQYHFTLDEVKHCFESFLNQKTNDGEHIEVQRVSELNLTDNQDMKKTVLTEEIDIKQELKQEINLVLDQEEQMYEDQTYWK